MVLFVDGRQGQRQTLGRQITGGGLHPCPRDSARKDSELAVSKCIDDVKCLTKSPPPCRLADSGQAERDRQKLSSKLPRHALSVGRDSKELKLAALRHPAPVCPRSPTTFLTHFECYVSSCRRGLQRESTIQFTPCNPFLRSFSWIIDFSGIQERQF